MNEQKTADITNKEISSDNKITADEIIDYQKSTIVYESKRVDEAFNFALDVDNEPIAPEIERRVVWKTDLFVFPLMCLIYGIQYLDKTSTSYGSVMGLLEDMNMRGQMFAWSGTCFYLGYLVFEFPASYALQRFPLAKTLGSFLVIWGVILAATSACNYAGFIALRTMLGIFESSVSPGFIMMTAQWYKRDEQPVRTAFWFSFNGVGTIIGGGMSYSLSKKMVRGELPMAGWKLVFIICGVLAIFLGLLMILFVPDTPLKARFFTEEEKKVVIKRLRINQQGVGNHHFKKDQFIEAFKDVRTWIMFVSAIAMCIPNGGITTFSALLMKGTMHWDSQKTLLMGIPGGAVEVVGLIGLGIICIYVKQRMVLALIYTAVCLAGSAMLAFAKVPGARLAGYYMFSVSPGSMVLFFSLVSTNISGSTKKATVSAMNLLGYCVGNIIGPQTFRSDEAPEYQSAKIAIVVCYCIGMITFPLYWFVNWKANKRRDEMELQGLIPDNPKNFEFADLTDFQNLKFRYVS